MIVAVLDQQEPFKFKTWKKATLALCAMNWQDSETCVCFWCIYLWGKRKKEERIEKTECAGKGRRGRRQVEISWTGQKNRSRISYCRLRNKKRGTGVLFMLGWGRTWNARRQMATEVNEQWTKKAMRKKGNEEKGRGWMTSMQVALNEYQPGTQKEVMYNAKVKLKETARRKWLQPNWWRRACDLHSRSEQMP